MSAAEAIESITCDLCPRFVDWFSQCGGAVAISTYQAGKVALLGWDGQQPTILMRDFEKPMGLTIDGPHWALATRRQIQILTDAPLLAPDFLPERPACYDALLLPRVTYHTGDLNVHEVAFGAEGLWFVNTQFSCLAGVSHDYCFVPRWKPPFISQLAPEDRCHLNGLAMRDGRPAFVTALGAGDTPRGWRENKASGGVLVDVASGEIVCSGLSMPHSPRCVDQSVWFLNSGAGELCRYLPGSSNRHEVIMRLPAFLRGLCIIGQHALVGLCRIRETRIFGGLPVQQMYDQLHCGVAVVDLARGLEIGRLEFTTGCTEVFDVAFVPNKRRPMLLSSEQEAARHAFPTPGHSYWLRPEPSH